MVDMAEGVGFEPTIRFPVYTLSKRAPSATRPSLRDRSGQYSRVSGADNPRAGGSRDFRATGNVAVGTNRRFPCANGLATIAQIGRQPNREKTSCIAPL